MECTMEKTYIITWTDQVSGRVGQGKKFMDKEEAVSLAQELNAEYPDFQHKVVNTAEPNEVMEEPVAVEAGASEEAPEAAVVQPEAVTFSGPVELQANGVSEWLREKSGEDVAMLEVLAKLAEEEKAA